LENGQASRHSTFTLPGFMSSFSIHGFRELR
jgi:hypothetical protein